MEQKHEITIDSLAVMKAYNHPVGNKIIAELDENALTATEIAERVQFPRDNIYYHIRKLEKVGLLIITDTEVINGITKKKYLASAKSYKIEPSIVKNVSASPKTTRSAPKKKIVESKLSREKTILKKPERSKPIKQMEDDAKVFIKESITKPSDEKKRTPIITSDKKKGDLLANLLRTKERKNKGIDEKTNIENGGLVEQKTGKIGKEGYVDSIKIKKKEYFISKEYIPQLNDELLPDLNKIKDFCETLLEKFEEVTKNNKEARVQNIEIEFELRTLLTGLIGHVEFLIESVAESKKIINQKLIQKDSLKILDYKFLTDIKYITESSFIFVEKITYLFEGKLESDNRGDNNLVEIRTLAHSIIGFSEMLLEITMDYIVQNAQKKDRKFMTIEEKSSLRGDLNLLLIDRGKALLRKTLMIKHESDIENHEDEEVEKNLKAQIIEGDVRKKTWQIPIKEILKYFYRLLNNYTEVITFVKTGNNITFLQASVKRHGFKVIKTESFSLPVRTGYTHLDDLPSLIVHIFHTLIPRKRWKKYYLGYFSSDYPIEIDFFPVPDMKKSETDEFIKNNISSRFSLNIDSMYADWIMHGGKKEDNERIAFCNFADRGNILKEYQSLIDSGIQPRFTTSIPKLQYDIYRYQYGNSSSGNALLLYFDHSKTWLTLLNNWEIVSCRQSWVGIKDFVDALDGINIQGRMMVSKEETEEWFLQNGMTMIHDEEDGSSQLNIVLSSVFQKFISEIKKTIRYFKSKGKKDFDSIFMGGPGAKIPDCLGLASDHLEMSVQHLKIDVGFEHLGDGKNEMGALINEDYTENIGLFLDPLNKVNLMPEDIQKNMRFLIPTRLIQGILVIFLSFSTFFAATRYFNLKNIETELPTKVSELQLAKNNQALYYKYLQDLTVINGYNRAKDFDQAQSKKFLYLLKYLSNTIPDRIVMTALSLQKNKGDEISITLNGFINAPGSASTLMLKDLKYQMESNTVITAVDILSVTSRANDKSLNFKIKIIL